MIVPTERLGDHQGAVAMVDGGFDPIHPGHIKYFEAAASLGAPVLCNISSDEYVATKHRLLLTQEQRGDVIDAIRWIDFVHLSKIPTSEVLRLLSPRYYVKGSDWEGRLPEEESRICREHGVEIVLLDTVVDSSTAILNRYDS